MTKKIIKTDKAPTPIGSYNQAVLVENTLYISGQIPLDATTGNLVTEDIQLATKKVMENIREILKEASMSFDNVIKTSIFVKDMRQFNQIDEIYASYFDKENAPARETIEVSNLPKFVDIEISAIASI